MTITASGEGLELSDYNTTSHEYETFYDVSGNLVPKTTGTLYKSFVIDQVQFDETVDGFNWDVVDSLQGKYYKITVGAGGQVKLLQSTIAYGTEYNPSKDASAAYFIVKVVADSTHSKLQLMENTDSLTGEEAQYLTIDENGGTGNKGSATGYFRFQAGVTTVGTGEAETHTVADKISATNIGEQTVTAA